MKIHERLKALREDHDLTQEEAARALKIIRLAPRLPRYAQKPTQPRFFSFEKKVIKRNVHGLQPCKPLRILAALGVAP